MSDRVRCCLFLLVGGMSLSGCSRFAKHPDSPAAAIPLTDSINAKAPPGEKYYLLVFGSQSIPKQAKYTHSWATVVRVSGSDTASPSIQESTISWMPATLEIHSFSRVVEPGTNLGLHTTIEEMLRHDERVSMWGPYEVGPGFYQRFQVQKAFLESGAIGYQCIDSMGEAARLGNGSDCIHAVTDMDPEFSRNRYPLSYFGERASRHIVHQISIRPIVISPEADHGWLLPALGLDRYSIVRQTYRGRSVPATPENMERHLRRAESRGK